MANQQHDLPVVEAQPITEINGKEFASLYYHILLNLPNDASLFYRETSNLGRPEPDGTFSFVTTLQAITNKIKSVHHNWKLEVINTVDFHTSTDGGMLMLVTGCMVLKDDSIKKDFVQSFFFDKESGYILNDIFRFMENSSTQIVARNPLPEQGFPERVEQQIRVEACIHTPEEQTNLEVVSKPSKGGECSTNDEMPPPVTSTPSFPERVEQQIRVEACIHTPEEQTNLEVVSKPSKGGECSTNDEMPPPVTSTPSTTISQLITTYRVWVPRKFSAILTIYTALWILVSVAFIPEDVGMPIARIVMDIVASVICFLAILDGNNNKAICVVNVLSILPLAMPYIVERFHLHMVLTRIPMFLVCYVLQICRLQAVRFAFIEAEKYSTWSYTVIGCAKILLVNFFLIHSPACFFYCLSKVTGDTWIVGDGLGHSISSLYGNAFYWSVTTFMSVGFGDVTPKKLWDKVCVGVYMFTNILGYSYIAGCVTNILVAGNIKMMEFRKRSRFMRRLLDMDGSSDIRRQIIQHLELEHSMSGEQIGQNQSINSLPEVLGEGFKCKIAHILGNDSLFDKVPTSVLYELISEMYAVYLSPKDVIIKREMKPTHLFLLLHGSVDIIRAGQLQRVSERKLLGIHAFIMNVLHQETIQAYDICHMVKLDRSSFFKVIRGNPGMGNIILDNLRGIHPDLKGDIDLRIHMGALDDYFTLSNAIGIKDWALVRRLIMRGMDSGRCNDGSTPLIDATRKRKKDIVYLLLTYGAPPNVTDTTEGNTALHYGMMLEDLEICKLLLTHGADCSIENKNKLKPLALVKGNGHHQLVNALSALELI